MVKRYLFAVLLAAALVQPLNAQPNLIFKRIEVTYPKISLAFKATCDGSFRNDIEPQHYEVYENGLKVEDATLVCPPEPECCVSVAMVLDRSGSMGENGKLESVQEGALAFVNSMNPDGLPCDEAAVVAFNQDIRIEQGMTSNKPLLTAAINRLFAFGQTAVWDAIGIGVQELVNSGTNRCKAVIVLTDGGDNSSKFLFSPQAVAHFALTQGVKVFTIGYGLPSPAHGAALEYIANTTGGEYFYSPLGGDLQRIYASIREKVQESYQECILSYETDCPDGSTRTVELVLKDFCGGTVSRTRTYVAPYDPSKFQNVGIRIGDAEVNATKEFTVPVMLETPVDAVFSKADISIGYDHNVLRCTGISTDGTLLEGRAVSPQLLTSTLLVRLEENLRLDTTGGVLFYVHFQAGDVANPTFTPLYLANWSFRAYCLTPMLRNGRVKINPREPILNCQVSAPGSLNWNDEEKRYEPNPFDVSVTVFNTGTKEAYSVQAILVTDPDIVQLVSPTQSTQLLSPSVIPPGGSATAQWKLLATRQEDLDSIPIYFSITSTNHPTVACWDRILVDPALESALVCDISAPDTIYFREQFYAPEEFDIQIRATNVGSGQTKDVRAQLLQDTRFTIVPPAHRQLSGVLLPTESAGGTFRVKIHPRQTDGYDTVRVNIQGDDTNPAWCAYPIWVERVRAPEFSLICTTPDDSLEFSDDTYDYVPNPFVVTTVAENIGETYAEDCQIMFVGPPSFTPVGNNPRPAGTMQIGDSHTEQWTVRALPRYTAAWDTLVFQVMGRGGLGRRIVLAECRLPVYVPAVRRPEYTLSCSAPDSLEYRDNRYQPDPMVFSMRVTNTGTAVGRGLSPTLVVPPSISLADGESADRYIPRLGINESVDLVWRLHPEMRGNDGVYRVCAQVIDSIGVSEQCCSDVFIPKTENPIIMPSCWSIDTLYLDTGTGEYLGNPFDVILNLTNVGLGAAENVRASINILGSFMTVVGDIEQQVGTLAANGSARLTWQVRALRRDAPADIPIVLTVESDNHPARECQVIVHIPAMQTPLLDAICSSIPEDSLFFDWETGQFVYPECTLTLTVTNNGKVDARNVRALLVVPSGVLLADGEGTQKTLSPTLLKPGESGTATWRFRAKRADVDVVRDFRFIARADNADDAECVDELFIEGSPKHVILSLPEYVLLRYGEKTDVPIFVDRTVGKDLSEYVLQFHFDPDVVSLMGVSNAGTLTGIGWVGAKIKPVAHGHVEISDYTTGTPLATEDGVLLRLQVEGIFNGNSSQAEYGESIMEIDSTVSLLNRGEISLGTRIGRVIATNQCLEPLLATENFVLRQNRPNPFNPRTLISFRLPKDDYVRLTVFDRHGREVATLVDGYREAGDHEVAFTADQLPSGLYFYRLESAHRFEVRKMILSR